MLDLANCPELLTPREMREADRFAMRAGVPGLTWLITSAPARLSTQTLAPVGTRRGESPSFVPRWAWWSARP